MLKTQLLDKLGQNLTVHRSHSFLDLDDSREEMTELAVCITQVAQPLQHACIDNSRLVAQDAGVGVGFDDGYFAILGTLKGQLGESDRQ
jgi:hypothetical protein